MTSEHKISLNLKIPNNRRLRDLLVNMADFDILSVLGEGQYGTVSLVREKKSGAKYASKALKVVDEIEILFKREVENMARFDHYTLLSLRGFTEYKTDSVPCILTEYCSKGELKDLIEKESRGLAPEGYDETTKFIIAYGIAYGMSILHKEKTMHRDIKPENIFLNDNYEPKIADFGLSKKIEGTIYQSEQVGSPLFMAPELLALAVDDEKQYTFPVDVYAYAMTLYNLCQIETPFKYLGKMSIFKLTNIILSGERPKFICDTPYKDLIIQCWDQEPENRPSFKKIIKELEKIAEDGDFIDLDVFEDYKIKFTEHKNKDDDSEKQAKKKAKKPKKKKPRGQLTIIQKLEKASDENNVASQIELANRYQNGEGVAQDYKKAMHYIKLAAKNGDTRAMVRYGVFLQEGIGLDSPDYEKAADMFEEAIEKDEDENAMYYYSILLLEGKGIDKDIKKGIEYLKKAADKEQTDAENKYGMMLEFGSEGVKKNIDQAIKYYKNSSEHGNEIGMFNYADILEKGKYVDKNEKEAARLFRLSYKRGYAPAICRYGEMLLDGRGVKQDVDEARRLILLAINNKYPSAYVSLGQMYLTGVGFDKNEKEATRLFKMAADAGSVRGMIQYGVSLEEGIGCRKDVVKALDFYKKAIAKGSTIALTKAAKLLLLGDDGVKEDLETAVNYLSKAKDNGDDDAASILEELFEDDEGDEVDED